MMQPLNSVLKPLKKGATHFSMHHQNNARSSLAHTIASSENAGNNSPLDIHEKKKQRKKVSPKLISSGAVVLVEKNL